jgi:hypothetical protein
MTDDDDSRIAPPTALYGPPDMTPDEFEEYVVELLKAAHSEVDDLRIQLHEKIEGIDGEYDFDGTVRFSFLGMDFLVLIEAKKHKYAIKRELVQVLYSKVQSVGAHKGFLISTAPFQSGAVNFALTHGIALATVTEGRFLYETRDAGGSHQISRAEAATRFGVPTFVSHVYIPADAPSWLQVRQLSLGSNNCSEYVADFLLGRPR